jgi:hypothetical protein
MKANLIHVERLGPVNVGYWYGDELNLPIHARQATCRL